MTPEPLTGKEFNDLAQSVQDLFGETATVGIEQEPNRGYAILFILTSDPHDANEVASHLTHSLAQINKERPFLVDETRIRLATGIKEPWC